VATSGWRGFPLFLIFCRHCIQRLCQNLSETLFSIEKDSREILRRPAADKAQKRSRVGINQKKSMFGGGRKIGRPIASCRKIRAGLTRDRQLSDVSGRSRTATASGRHGMRLMLANCDGQ